MTKAPRSPRPPLSLAAGQLLGWALLIPISVAVLTLTPSDIKLLPDKPVVLLFVVDTMRGDLLDGRYADLLPNFTQLANTGVQFLNARSAASLALSLTVPSRVG